MPNKSKSKTSSKSFSKVDRVEQQVVSLKQHLNGHELKPGPNPPEFTSRPWYELTVRIESIGATFSLRNLIDAMRSQLGIPDLLFFIRLQSVRVWSPLVAFSAGPLQPLSVAIADVISETNTGTGTLPVRILEQYTRYPNQTNRACVGYSYPATQSNVALYANDTTLNLSLLRTTGTGDGSVCYYRVLWRPGVSVPEAAVGKTSTSTSWF